MNGGESEIREPLLLTIPQVMRELGLGRTTIYHLIDHEGLPVVRFGRAVRVSYASLKEWLRQREGRIEYH